MERKWKRYEILVDVSVAEGCFSSVHDLMEYVRYRLDLRGRDTDNIKMNSVCVLREHNQQMEIGL